MTDRPHIHDARCTNCGKTVRITGSDDNPALIRLFEWVIWLNGLCTKCWKEHKDFRK